MIFARRRSCSREKAEKLVFSHRILYTCNKGVSLIFFDCRRQAFGLPAPHVLVTENGTTSRLPDKFICLEEVLFKEILQLGRELSSSKRHRCDALRPFFWRRHTEVASLKYPTQAQALLGLSLLGGACALFADRRALCAFLRSPDSRKMLTLPCAFIYVF
ncbi:hypothetical protein GFC30_2331 [Anoxybacillus amylolyticus]|uniref:Uncharacterized protein n=1 Tax=Anoxybacteroides amylolyticum TaxID=294699 RepID=A0A167TGH5_9BACL|nr:hypothetical protein GFC30_2331 [Anoxybacillus amylolyticus]